MLSPGARGPDEGASLQAACMAAPRGAHAVAGQDGLTAEQVREAAGSQDVGPGRAVPLGPA